jgi:hypothetical protein
MNLYKIITDNKELISQYMTKNMSYDEGIINVVIGWDLAKEMGAKITDHKIDDKTYWTFLPTEKRKIFTEHLKEFKKIAFNEVKKEKIFLNINPFDFKTKESLIEFISNKLTGKSTYLFNESFYIYDENNIHHIDMGLLNFMSWDIITDIKNILEIKELKKEYKEYLKYLEIKYIPYLIDAKENITISNIC